MAKHHRRSRRMEKCMRSSEQRGVPEVCRIELEGYATTKSDHNDVNTEITRAKAGGIRLLDSCITSCPLPPSECPFHLPDSAAQNYHRDGR